MLYSWTSAFKDLVYIEKARVVEGVLYVRSHCRCYWSGEVLMRMRIFENFGACLK